MCRKNQECKNTIGSYICVLKCGTGFTAAPNGLECQGTVSVNYCANRFLIILFNHVELHQHIIVYCFFDRILA